MCPNSAGNVPRVFLAPEKDVNSTLRATSVLTAVDELLAAYVLRLAAVPGHFEQLQRAGTPPTGMR
jgi:hypothetical protein